MIIYFVEYMKLHNLRCRAQSRAGMYAAIKQNQRKGVDLDILRSVHKKGSESLKKDYPKR